MQSLSCAVNCRVQPLLCAACRVQSIVVCSHCCVQPVVCSQLSCAVNCFVQPKSLSCAINCVVAHCPLPCVTVVTVTSQELGRGQSRARAIIWYDHACRHTYVHGHRDMRRSTWSRGSRERPRDSGGRSRARVRPRNVTYLVHNVCRKWARGHHDSEVGQ